MGIAKSRPVHFTPRGLCDAFDSTDAFPGACQSLQNLVFDQSNPEYVVSRPGVVSAADLVALGVTGAGFISVQECIGTLVYGLVASSLNPGREQPFIVDLGSGQLIPVAGMGVLNTPAAAATSGDWTPPTIAQVGPYVIFTHPGFSTTQAFGGYFGVISSNVATWNPSDKGSGVTLSNNNLTASFAATSNVGVRATNSVSAGKFYWEVTVGAWSGNGPLIGVATGTAALTNYLGSDAFGWSYQPTGNKLNNSSATAYGPTYTTGDVIGVLLDMNANTLSFTKNGVSLGVAFSGLPQVLFPAASGGTSAINGVTVNFGASAFAHAPPAGYGPLTGYLWTAQNTTGNGLVGVPSAVSNFSNRAYFAVGNQVQFTDVLTLNRTNASQGLTIGDSTPVNALAGLPLQTTGSGVLQALTIFKAAQIWQVTGDTATANLALNFLSLSIGTTMPRSIAQAPMGIYFGSTGGPYMVDPLGAVRQLTHSPQQQNPDVTVPFQNATTPTRWAGAYVSGIYRVCGPTTVNGAAVVNDYWFDERRRRWSGPHSFAYDCASVVGSNFLLSSINFGGKLMTSQPLPNTPSAAYVDLGTAFQCTLASATFPKSGDMLQKQVAESEIELGDAASYVISALDESGATMDSLTITTAGSNPPTWGGGGVWGSGVWSSTLLTSAKTYAVPWHAPLVFEKMALSISTIAAAHVQMGTFQARYQETGYMTTKQGV